MLHIYKSADASTCLASRRVVFIGDSVTRKLFFQLSNLIDPKLPTAPTDKGQKHVDHTLRSAGGTQLDFFWDPFLNSSHMDDIIYSQLGGSSIKGAPSRRPALLVLGSGLWYLRYSGSSGGISAWEAKLESTLSAITDARVKLADEIVVLPIEEVVPAKLSHERANSMRLSDIDAMNSDLLHRIHPPAADSLGLLGSVASMPVSLPLVFNQMLDPLQTEDGLHYSDTVVKAQANVLLNLRCNDVLPKQFPFDKTCCRKYPWPNSLQLVILGIAVLWGPCSLLLSRQSGSFFSTLSKISRLRSIM